MVFRATGPGKAEIDRAYSSPGMLKALLYNFDFDDMKSSGLKAEHSRFLTEQVVPLLAKDRGHIWMRGSASQVGIDSYNMELSKTRVNRVANFLTAAGIFRTQMQLEAIGEELTVGHAADDERDRGVALLILPKKKSEPPPKPAPPPKPKIASKFKAAMITGLSAAKAAKWAKYLKGKVGAGVAADVIFFQIWDVENNLSSIYVYVGGGIGVGVTLLPSVSATTHGPWNDFTTSAAISCSQFDGFTRFTTAGVAKWSLNFLNMCGTPPGVDDVYISGFNTGTTIGLGASSTVGDMTLLEGPDPFSGP
jgi:hypothetical protein